MNMNFLQAVTASALIAFSGYSLAHNDMKSPEYRIGQLKIEYPYARATGLMKRL